MAEGRKLEGLAHSDPFLNGVLDGLLTLNVNERRGGKEVDHFRAVMVLAVNQALRQMGIDVPRPYAGVVRDFLRHVRISEDMLVKLMSLISPVSGTQPDVLRRLFPSMELSVDGQKPIYRERLKDLLQLRLLAGGLDMWEQFLIQARETNIDPLTQLLNRRGLDHYIRSILDEDPNAFGAVLLLDIDHFKRVNDVHGHPKGDEAIQHVSQVFETAVRLGPDELFRLKSDSTDHEKVLDNRNFADGRDSNDADNNPNQVVRMGGEEILAVLPGVTQLIDALHIAERVRQGIEESAPGVLSFPLTATMGVTVGSLKDISKLVQFADVLLYRGKNDGRNRVVGASYQGQNQES